MEKKDRMPLMMLAEANMALNGNREALESLLTREDLFRKQGWPTLQQMLEQYLQDNPQAPDSKNARRIIQMLKTGKIPEV